MIRTTARAGALACALLATTAIMSPAQAQEYVAPEAPPIRETIDENGVDLTRGALVSRSHSVSIGGPGRMGLSWSRSVTSNGSFRDSTGIFLNAPVGATTITVTLASRSESFTVSGSNYISKEKTGATLTLSSGVYTLTDRDGVVYSFSPWFGDIEQYGGTHRVTSVVYPTGERLTFNYETEYWCIYKPTTGDCISEGDAERLKSVEATNGYRLLFDFALSTMGGGGNTRSWMTIAKVTAQNMSVDPASQSWPTLTLNGVNSFTDSLNRTTSYTYTSGALTGIKRPGASSNNVSIAYSSGKVSSVTNEGVATNYSYADASGVRTTTISDAILGNRVVKTNLATMLVTSDTNELGKATAYEYYTDSGLLKKVTAPEGNNAAFEYDGRGNRTKTTLFPKSGTATIVTEASYPASDTIQTWQCASGTPAVTCNKPLTTKDARANVTNYEWSSTTGEITKATLPAPSTGAVRPETRYSYSSVYAQYRNSSGTLVNFATPITRLTGISACQVNASCAGTADEVKSTNTYGTANRLPVSVASGSGNGSLTATTAFTYDTVGNRLTVDGPLAGTADTTRTRYDAARQVVGVVGPDPDGTGALLHRAQRLTYNADGQVTKTESGTVTSQTDPAWTGFSSLEAVETAYNADARPVTQKLTSGTTTYALTQASYDAIGRLDCTAQRMNTAEFGSPPTACTQGSLVTDRIARIAYDAANRPLSVTTGLGAGANIEAVEATVTYTNNGKVATIKDARNNVTTNAYDGFDRLVKTSFPNATSTTGFVELTLDSAGNVTAFRNRAGQTIYFTHDDLNRVTTKNLPGTEPDVTYAYDNLSRLTSASHGASALSFTYDALSRNLTESWAGRTATSTWDLAGRRTQLAYPGGGLNVNYDYLVTGDMTKVRENGATSGVGVLATYAYDNLGRRTSVNFGNGVVQAFGYDPVSRLTSLTNNLSGTAHDLTIGSMSYNPASQIVSQVRSNDLYAWTGHYNENKTGTPNALNQLTQYGAKALDHDLNGNVIEFGAKTFTYSSENLVKSHGATPLAYDPAMRLYEVSAGPGSIKFAYDGLDRIAEYEGTGTLQRRYVHGPGVDEPIVWYEGSGLTDRRFLSSDERGSIISVTSSTGNLMAVNKYDEYGQPQSTNTGKWGYTGQAWVPEIGEYYYKARMYAPELGRFLQPDPIGYVGGMNLYSFVRNDPVNFVDPLGLVPQLPGNSCTTDQGAQGTVNLYGVCEADPIVVTGSREPRPFLDLLPFNFDREISFEIAAWGGIGSERGTSLEPKRQCIPESAGPVAVKGGTFTMSMILGGSFSVGSFEIPSIGASGRFSSGSANAGFEGFLGAFTGSYSSFGAFVGRYGGVTLDIRGVPFGGGFTVDSSGNITGGFVSGGAGGGASVSYGGTHIISSNMPPCGG